MIKVNYNTTTTLVQGYYPDTINYPSIPTPFIEINESEQVFDKQMCVVNGVYQEYVKPLDIQLKEAKEAKIIQLKANRDSALNEPLTSKKAFEYDVEVNQVLDNEVYFEFSTKPTNNPLTEPANLLFTALFGTNIAYSCNIIEGESTRKGYVQITQSLAQSLSVHLQERANNYVQETNRIEAQIEACETLEELENININFI